MHHGDRMQQLLSLQTFLNNFIFQCFPKVLPLLQETQQRKKAVVVTFLGKTFTIILLKSDMLSHLLPDVVLQKRGVSQNFQP